MRMLDKTRNDIELADISLKESSMYSTSKALNNNNNDEEQCKKCHEPPAIPSIIINAPPEENRAPIVALPNTKPEVLLCVPSKCRLGGISSNDLDLQMGDGVGGYDLESGRRNSVEFDLGNGRRGSYGFEVVVENGGVYDVQTVSGRISPRNGGVSFVDGFLDERQRRELLFGGASEVSLGGPGRTDSQEELIIRTNSEAVMHSSPKPLQSPRLRMNRQSSALRRTFSMEQKKKIDRCLTYLGEDEQCFRSSLVEIICDLKILHFLCKMLMPNHNPTANSAQNKWQFIYM